MRSTTGVDGSPKTVFVTQVWEVKNPARVVTSKESEEQMAVPVFSPDGVHMARAHGATIRVSEAPGTDNGRDLTLAGGVFKYSFEAGGKYIAALGGQDHDRVQVWEAATGRPAAPPLALDRAAGAFQFSPDGKYLAAVSRAHKVGERSEVRVWEWAGGREVVRAQFAGGVTGLLFSPDGNYAVTSGDDESESLFDLVGHRVVGILAHDGPVRDVTFSPDGRYVATAGDDQTARVWETSSGREVARVTHDGSVTSAVFTRDGRLATVGDDLTARLWPISERELIERACNNLTRSLSPDEWRRNFGNEKYAQTCRGKTAGKGAGESEGGAAGATQQ